MLNPCFFPSHRQKSIQKFVTETQPKESEDANWIFDILIKSVWKVHKRFWKDVT